MEKQTIYTIKQAFTKFHFKATLRYSINTKLILNYLIILLRNQRNPKLDDSINIIYDSSYDLKKTTKIHNKVGNIIIDSFYPSQEPLLVSALEPRANFFYQPDPSLGIPVPKQSENITVINSSKSQGMSTLSRHRSCP